MMGLACCVQPVRKLHDFVICRDVNVLNIPPTPVADFEASLSRLHAYLATWPASRRWSELEKGERPASSDSPLYPNYNQPDKRGKQNA